MGIVRGEEAEEIAEVFQELQKGEEDEEAGEVRGSASVGLAVCKINPGHAGGSNGSRIRRRCSPPFLACSEASKLTPRPNLVYGWWTWLTTLSDLIGFDRSSPARLRLCCPPLCYSDKLVNADIRSPPGEARPGRQSCSLGRGQSSYR
ncbi:hypothetical protein E2C01_014468 [Portunus trituberculatus]|uniref:Uncharacterized protein n=1 Tax=Portunus trituberculatus TaxID=210409 RepID=A0A5B7DJA2_PORTR|nr:hypothetical protein [Portunus trituberculatus]